MKIKDINLEYGADSSKIASEYAKTTYNNSKKVELMTIENGFSNGFRLNSSKIGISSDGIGTKVELAERMNRYDTLGFDLVAMVVDDLISNGYNPLLISNILDVNYLDKRIIDKLFMGLSNACKFADIIISGGEIAELGSRISGFNSKDNIMHINWAATGIGTLFEGLENPIYGKEIKSGDSIYGVLSDGFRSNGFTLARSILEVNYGKDWHDITFNGKKWGDILLIPSLIYTPFIRTLFTKKNMINSIKAIIHITGGGIYNNLKRVTSKNLRVKIDKNSFTPHKTMLELQKLASISDQKAYDTWNMGIGMIIISNQEIESTIIKGREYQVKKIGVFL